MYGRHLFQKAVYTTARTSLRQFPGHARRSAGMTLRYQYIPTAAANTTRVFQREYTTNDSKIVDFDEIQSLVKNNAKNTHLIDVREPAELAQGSIPTAKNIPLSKFQNAWTASSEDFRNDFGFDKPEYRETIVVYCQAGVRSARAAEYLRQLGYSGVLNYYGSWADYAERTKAK
ncbi:hypothetical protein DFQ28_006354 [Apophysomyces sp. BC1034]|nr:hypothetical protein DFQ30_006118 [Apophysomyces sp. BC1015]KAG0176465.1 hypothetical protein DFQ29_006092 [Apophysomyces sp. BC1021]KAG0193131.1 hypothetical protein DFQ28_006354 [Apophysomyces sp. BC1034]